MKSVFYTELRRSIAHSVGRFVAIAIIAALGCGFFAGLRMTPLDMDLSADIYYDQTGLGDIRVVSTLGLDDENIKTLAAVEGVEAAVPDREADVYALLGDTRYVMRFHGIPMASARASTTTAEGVASDDSSYLNRPMLIEGAWPERSDECAIAGDAVLDTPPHVGDTVEVVAGEGSADSLSTARFKVTGLVRSSYYVETSSYGSSNLGSGEIDAFVFVDESAFDKELPYTGAHLTVAGAADELYPSDAYDEVVGAVVSRLEALGATLADQRLGAIKKDAQDELDEKRADYEDAKADAEHELANAKDKLDASKSELDNAASTLSSSRSELASSEQKIASSEAELAAAKKKLDAGEKELSDKEAELAAGEKELEAQAKELDAKAGELAAAEDELTAAEEQAASAAQAAQAEIAAAEQQISQLPEEQQEAARAELEQKKAELEAQKSLLANKRAQLEDGKQQLASGRAQLDAAKQEIASGKAQLEAGKAELEKNRRAYQDGLAKLSSGKSQLAQGRAQLEQGEAEYEEGLAKWQDGKDEYEQGRKEALEELDDAKAKIDDAQKDIDELEPPDIFVLDRDKNYGAASHKSDAQRIDRIARVFPFIFFLVAALVSLTTMTRMVDEERILIGTYKALGYSNAKIISKYLIYAACASITGCIVGVGVLTQFLPAFIMYAYAIIYDIPVVATPINPPIAIAASALAVGITVGATWIAAQSQLREKPAQLMLPRVPKAGKRILLERITPLWRRLSFTSKVTARNLFRYKRRMAMTVVGIAGCTALLLTGFGLNNGINDIIDIQFGEILHYNLTVTLDDDAAEKDLDTVEDVLVESELVKSTTRVGSQTGLAGLAGEDAEEHVQLVIPQDVAAIDQFITMRERLGHAPLALDDDGVIVSEKLSLQLGLHEGDSFEVYDTDEAGDAQGDAHTLVVSGIAEYYTGEYIYLTPAAYEQAFGEPCSFTSFLANAPGSRDKRDALANDLLGCKGVAVASYYDEIIETYRTMLSSVNAVCVVLIIAAALLAFVVLFNLTNINIGERIREIATLKVLGFTKREVDLYIFRETLLLTLIGSVVGCVFGIWLEGFVVATAEVDQMMFGRTIHASSFVLSIALTVVFSFLVMLVMRRKLARVDMVESLKSVE